ncbi:MAG: hypothetical protein QXQ70_10255 [Candidatus Caldarchaeum sp.]
MQRFLNLFSGDILNVQLLDKRGVAFMHLLKRSTPALRAGGGI